MAGKRRAVPEIVGYAIQRELLSETTGTNRFPFIELSVITLGIGIPMLHFQRRFREDDTILKSRGNQHL